MRVLVCACACRPWSTSVVSARVRARVRGSGRGQSGGWQPWWLRGRNCLLLRRTAAGRQATTALCSHSDHRTAVGCLPPGPPLDPTCRDRWTHRGKHDQGVVVDLPRLSVSRDRPGGGDRCRRGAGRREAAGVAVVREVRETSG